MTRTVEVADDLHWLFECHPIDDGVHMHVSQFVITADDRTVLVDAGLEFDDYLVEEIEACTGGRGVDALLLTNSILPHTRSANAVGDHWDDVTIVSAASSPPIVGIDHAESKVLNSTRPVVGRDFTFMDSLLTDVVNSNWIFDHDSGALFTAEGVGHYHSPSTCAATSADLADAIPYEHVHRFQHDKLAFLRYVDPAKLRRATEAVFGRFDVERIVPAHGNPVEADDVEAYLDRVLRSAEAIAAGGGEALEAD